MTNNQKQIDVSRWKEITWIVVIVGVVGFCLYFQMTHPNHRAASGFGPEWECTTSGRAGPDFCIKKDLLNQTK